jgi:N-acetylmuramidase
MTIEYIAAEDLLAPQPMPANNLTAADFASAATRLGCEVAAIKAVVSVETGDAGAFDAEGRPTILFEQRYFSCLTHHQYDATHPQISSMARGGYGHLSEQYGKLQQAVVLNLDAALRSASWGAFQIMGDNHKVAGFDTAEAMVTAMRSGVAAHLNAFVSFILADERLTKAIRAKDWATFATHYNGPGYALNHYDTKLAIACAKNL